MSTYSLKIVFKQTARDLACQTHQGRQARQALHVTLPANKSLLCNEELLNVIGRLRLPGETSWNLRSTIRTTNRRLGSVPIPHYFFFES